MTRRLVCSFALVIGLAGCFRDFNVDDSLRQHSPHKAECAVQVFAPVLPEQVRSENAHQIAASLWDEIDREAKK